MEAKDLAIIQVYTPTSAAETADIDEFYASLQQTSDDAPRQDIVLVMGDLNAIEGKEEATKVSGKFGSGQRNKAGDGVIKFCTSNNMKNMNTTFEQPKRRLYTWTSPNGLHKNQIDYIISAKRWSSSIQYNMTLPGADCGSGHELLVAGVKIKLKKIRKGTLPQRYDLTATSHQFIAEVKNRIKHIDVGTSQPEEFWKSIKRAVRKAEERNLKNKGKQKRAVWLSETAIQIAANRRKLKASCGDKNAINRLNGECQRSGGDKNAINRLNGDCQRQARRDKELWINALFWDIEAADRQGKSRDLFQKVKVITGKFTPRNIWVKYDRNKNITEREEMKEKVEIVY